MPSGTPLSYLVIRQHRQGSRELAAYRILQVKGFAIAELVALMMALALPLIPRRGSEELINLPSEAAGYFHSVLLCFGLLNGILLALVVCWGYWIGKGRLSS